MSLRRGSDLTATTASALRPPLSSTAVARSSLAPFCSGTVACHEANPSALCAATPFTSTPETLVSSCAVPRTTMVVSSVEELDGGKRICTVGAGLLPEPDPPLSQEETAAIVRTSARANLIGSSLDSVLSRTNWANTGRWHTHELFAPEVESV